MLIMILPGNWQGVYEFTSIVINGFFSFEEGLSDLYDNIYSHEETH